MHLKRVFIAVALYAIAMGFLEAAVVVYLRLHFYPSGFSFPLTVMPDGIAWTEVAREVATILMLAAVGWLAGHDRLSRFSCFSIAFGIWDIFYYVFLKLLLGWPSSLLTNDVLFLIPLPWIGPVLAPVLVSLCLTTAGFLILHRESKGRQTHITPLRWAIMAAGGMVILFSFLQNSIAAMQQQPLESFNWFVFAAGMLVGISAFFSSLKQQ